MVDERPEGSPASPVPQPRSSMRRSATARPASRDARPTAAREARGTAIIQSLEARRRTGRHIGRTAAAHKAGSWRRRGRPRRAAPIEPGAVRIVRIGASRARSAAIAPSRSPSRSRMSPSANHAVAKSGASSTVCASTSAAAAKSPRAARSSAAIVAPVGDQVAGRDEKWAVVGIVRLAPRIAQ